MGRREQRRHPDSFSVSTNAQPLVPFAMAESRDREGDRPDTDADSGQGVDATGIPEALYDKAQNHQDQLTHEERRLLLGRGDAIGKALAHPDSLTAEETHRVLLWPPPDVVRANIQRATGGSLSTPHELYAKAKDALAHGGKLEPTLSHAEILLLARSLRGTEDWSADAGNLHAPGASQARELISHRLGVPDPRVAVTAMLYQRDRSATVFPYPSKPLGRGPYSPADLPHPSPLHHFLDDLPDRGSHLTDRGVVSAWTRLSADQKDVYYARFAATRGAMPCPRTEDGESVPGMAEYSGFKVFAKETGLGANGLLQMLRRWVDLTDEQRVAYDARAVAEVAAFRAAYQQRRDAAARSGPPVESTSKSESAEPSDGVSSPPPSL
ncbi:hypothetical protein BT67DRAFT_7525 [Trichocladium antarcticum]|uniref:Uncharacterized protein n=1 Tax=Trichocladium antarcticum TaxID=1450529 RepID=A0AAN6ZH95_9PEZI|nr:hypothetical protein BT67DRAFT_7525 [Trichocladium antarcticum]